MNNLMSLLKISLINSFGINKITKGTTKDRIKYISILLIISLSLLVFFISNIIGSVFITESLKEYQMAEITVASALITSFLMVFILNIIKNQGAIFNSREYEKVIVLPIKEEIILAVKIIELLILSYIFLAFVYLSQIISYGYVLGKGIKFYIIVGLMFIFIPLIPIILATIIGFFIKKFSMKFSNIKILNSILTTIFSVIIIIISFTLGDLTSWFIENKEIFSSLINEKIGVFRLLISIFRDENILSLCLFILISLLSFTLFLKAFSKLYGNMNQILQESTNKSKLKVKYKESSVFMSLLKKELMNYISIPIYLTNTAIGAILVLVGAIASIFFNIKVIGDYFAIPQIEQISPVIVLGFLIVVSSLTCTTNSSISLEGKSMWITKSLPIPPKLILKSKIALNLIILIPTNLIALIIFKFTFNINIYDFLLVLASIIIFSFIVSILGIITNIYFVNLNWTNETQVVKQGFSVLLEMIIIFIIITGGAIISGKYLLVNYSISLLLCLIYLVVVIFILIFFLNKIGIKRYEKIN